MKLCILKSNLVTALRALEKIAAKNLNLPILENLLLTTEKNFLILMGTDLEVAIRYWALAKIEKEGTIVVPARFFSHYASSLELDKVCFRAENNLLSIGGQGLETKLKLSSPDDFPPFPSFGRETSLSVSVPLLIEGLKQIVDTASFSRARPELSGVFFQFQPDCIKIASTDTFRLAEKTLYLEEKNGLKASLIMPAKTIRELINVFSDKEGGVSIYFSKNYIAFELLTEEISHPRIQVFSRLLEGEYPDYQEIVPTKCGTQVIVSRENLLNQIKTAGLFSGKVNEIKLNIKPKQRTIEISSQDPDLGENKSTLTGEIKGSEAKTSFNWKFLADGLSNMKSREVSFEINGEEGPAILRPVGDQSYFYVVMPIKMT